MLFIVNPISGNGRKRRIIKEIKRRGYRVAYTEFSGHASEIAAFSDDEKIVAVGGYGTVNEIVRSLYGSGKILGILPCGSGDGLALHLGISRNYKKALETITTGHTKSMDIGKMNDRIFASVCGVGFDAIVSQEFAKSGKRGMMNYVLQGLKVWRKFTPEEYTVTTDGKSFVIKAAMITVCNSNQWGNGAIIAPLASSDDALLDITIVAPFSFGQIPRLAFRLMTGKLHKDKGVKCLKASKVQIIRATEGPAHLDGDCYTCGKVLDISVIPGAIDVIIP